MLKEVHSDLKRRMDKAVADFQTHLVSLRTGRASVQLLDQVRVDYYGTPTPLTQIAQVTTPEASTIVVQPWDVSLLKEIEKALRAPEHGFNPSNDGKLIRVPIPPMTEERRRGVVKQLNQELEDHKTLCATSAAMATTTSRSSPKTRRSAKTRKKAGTGRSAGDTERRNPQAGRSSPQEGNRHHADLNRPHKLRSTVKAVH